MENPRQPDIPVAKAQNETKVSAAETTIRRSVGLHNLPDIPVLMICAHLNLTDLLAFSKSCGNISDICEEDQKVWSEALQREIPEWSDDFMSLAASIVETQTLFECKNWSKLAALMYFRTKENWSQSDDVQDVVTLDRIIGLRFKMNNKSSFLVVTSHRRQVDLTIWDLRCRRSKQISLCRSAFPNFCIEADLFNDFLLMNQKIGNHFIFSRLDLKNDEIKTWKTCIQSGFQYIDVFENIYVVVSCPCHHKVLLTGFSTDNGSEVFSHSFDEIITLPLVPNNPEPTFNPFMVVVASKCQDNDKDCYEVTDFLRLHEYFM